MASLFIPKYSVLQLFICRDPDVSSCVSGWFPGCSGWYGTYQARLRGPAEKGVPYSSTILTPPSLFFLRFYLFICHRQTKRTSRGRGKQGEKQAPCLARSPIWNSTPGLWDHDLNQRQMLHQLRQPGTPTFSFQWLSDITHKTGSSTWLRPLEPELGTDI